VTVSGMSAGLGNSRTEEPSAQGKDEDQARNDEQGSTPLVA